VANWRIDQRAADDDVVRRLRIHVSRLHAGLVAAEIVLGLCHSERLDPNHQPVERFLVSTLDALLQPQRHGFSNADLLGQVLGHARDVYWDTVETLRYAMDSLDNPKIRSRAAAFYDLVTQAVDPRRQEILVNVKELVMTRYESKISGTINGPVNTGSGGAHQHIGADSAQLPELLAQLTTALTELSANLPPADAVAAEDAAAGLAREADRAPQDRAKPGIVARLSSLFEIATRAGGAGTVLAAAVTAVRAAFGV
jgi:hypothetical protein